MNTRHSGLPLVPYIPFPVFYQSSICFLFSELTRRSRNSPACETVVALSRHFHDITHNIHENTIGGTIGRIAGKLSLPSITPVIHREEAIADIDKPTSKTT